MLLIIGGTFMIISRRDLTTVEAIGLLLLVWAIPVLGVMAVMTYLWLVARRRKTIMTKEPSPIVSRLD